MIKHIKIKHNGEILTEIDNIGNILIYSGENKGKNKEGNQVGKSTMLDLISYLFDKVKRKEIDYKLYNSGEDRINSINFEIDILNGNKLNNYNVIRKQKIDKYYYHLDEIKVNDRINAEELIKLQHNLPNAINTRKIRRGTNSIQTAKWTKDDPSYGLYYQVFVVDEKEGWKRYDENSFGGYNEFPKERIDIYLYSLLNDEIKTMEIYEKLKEFTSGKKNNELFYKANSMLTDIAKETKVNEYNMYVKIKKNNDIEKQIKQITEFKNEIISLNALKKQLKVELEEHKFTNDKISKVISANYRKIEELFDITKLVNISDFEINESENEMEEIKKKIKKYKNLIKENEKNIEWIISNKPTVTEEEVREELIIQEKEKALKRIIKENTFEAGDDLSKLLEQISLSNANIIYKNQRTIIEQMISCLKLNDEINEENKTKNINLLIKMKELCSEKDYIPSGALNNVKILSERLAIIRALKGKIPFFLIDSPYQSEVNPNNSENGMTILINWLMKEFTKETIKGKIGQLFIATADSENLEKSIKDENEFPLGFKADVAKMNGITSGKDLEIISLINIK